MTGATDLAYGLDPALFARACGYELDAWQVDLMRSPARRVLLCASRQSGKSQVTALVAAYEALFRPGSLTLILAPAERQSRETFAKVTDAYAAFGAPVPADSATQLSLRLANTSRVIALPGANEHTIRGYSGVDLLIVDEASRVSDGLYFSLRPMLAVSGGRMICLSTPWGRRGFFFTEWDAGGPDWLRIEVPGSRCPRIDPRFLEEERRSLPPLVFQSEYECVFCDNETAAFSSADIERARRDDIPPLFPAAPPVGAFPAAPAPRGWGLA